MIVAKKLYPYRSEQFGVTRKSPHSVTVNVLCGEHEHGNYLVQLIVHTECEWMGGTGGEIGSGDWTVGLEVGLEGKDHPFEGDFAGAIEHAADLLLEECKGMRDIGGFFGSEAGMETTDKFLTYRGREYMVTSDSSFSAMMNISCEKHEHPFFVIGLIMGRVEAQAVEWVMWRPEAPGPRYSHEGEIAEAVERTAILLLRECLSMTQVGEFFKEA